MDTSIIREHKSRAIEDSIKEDTGSLKKHFIRSLSCSSKKPKVGWLCTYTPEELINAAGFIPVRIFGNKKLDRSVSYFPTNFCPYLKSAWESMLENSPELEGIIFTSSCDGMRRLYDTAEKYITHTPSFMLDVPRISERRQVDFFTLNIKKMRAFLEKLAARKISESQLRSSVLLINKKRFLLSRLGSLLYQQPGSPGRIDIIPYYMILQVAMTSDPEVFTEELEAYLKIFESTGTSGEPGAPCGTNKRPPVMIIGNFINENRLWNLLSDLDLHLAAEDLCVSNRYFEKEVPEDASADILKSISARYLTKPACMRMADLGSKLNEIREKAISQKVKGLIFISLKFCDNMLYSFPLVKKELTDLKIPVLYLEIEYNNFPEGQLKTRLQAFLEML
ncbi:MAG: 2-hydroxyacyl-CoA dehydratase [Actinobacteria bacterium]|nr:2-hydroxyacyl-CoA dehydratase [Actinomycetota bacterium]